MLGEGKNVRWLLKIFVFAVENWSPWPWPTFSWSNSSNVNISLTVRDSAKMSIQL